MDRDTTLYIERFTPRAMNAIEWQIARPSVIEAVVQAMPRSREDAKALLCAAVAFLSSPCGWNRVDAPPLANLLTDASIEVFARSGVKGAHSLAVYSSSLRALHPRAGLTRSGRAVSHTASAAVSQLQDASAETEVSAVALIRARERMTGRPVSRIALGQVAAANATPDCAGTVVVDIVSVSALLETEDRDFDPEVVTTATTPRSTKLPSARQQRSLARADRVAAARAQRGPRLAEHPDLSALRPDVREALEAYRPQGIDPAIWVDLRGLAVRLVAGVAPFSVVSARNALTIVSQFLVWVWGRPERPDPGVPPTPAELLGSTLVDRYADGIGTGLRAAGVPGATISTSRSVLRRAVNSLDADYAPTSIPAAPLAPPYDPAQCDLFVELAQSQPNPAAPAS